MARIVGIMGDTGYGKSMSPIVPVDGIIKTDKYEGLNLKETVLFNLDKKEPPFIQYQKVFDVYKKAFGDFPEKRILQPDIDNFLKQLEAVLNTKKEIKNIIIDTFSFGMFRQRMKTENQVGFEKWSKLNVKFWRLLESIQTTENRDDLIVWILFHTEEGKDRDGNTVYYAKIEGNLLKKVPEKIITNMFFATKKGKDYVFETQANGTTAKNPPLLFNETIPNSLKLIRDTLIDGKLYTK